MIVKHVRPLVLAGVFSLTVLLAGVSGATVMAQDPEGTETVQTGTTQVNEDNDNDFPWGLLGLLGLAGLAGLRRHEEPVRVGGATVVDR